MSSQNKADSIGNIIKNKTPFLNKFKYHGYQDKNGMNIWTYGMVYTDYKFYVFIAEKNGRWKAKLDVYWKKHSTDLTNGAGKDFILEIGPYPNFEQLISQIELKTKNNPIMGKHVFADDYLYNMDLEAVPLMKNLKEKGHELKNVDDPYFDDIKKIYKDIQNLKEKSFLTYCKIHNPLAEDKQDFILDLQKLEKLDYYTAMFNMNHF